MLRSPGGGVIPPDLIVCSSGNFVAVTEMVVIRMDSLPRDLSSATLLQFVEAITKEPDQVQGRVLSAILEQNQGCEYLARHGFRRGERADRAAFKAKLPVGEYEDIREDIQRIANGDKSALLCVPPVTEFFTSSGTSGGARKFFPSLAGDKFRKNVNDAISIAFLDREVPGLQDGKALYLFTIRKSVETKSGLLAHTVLTRAFKDIFAPGAVNSYRKTVTSPGEVFLCPEENNQVIYCHLLCALLQRHSIVRVRAIFASFLVRAFRYLVEAWPVMCDDIRHGKLKPGVKDPAVRAALEKMLQPNPRLADEIEAIMSDRCGFQGLIPRMFPNARIVEAITTGSMAAYISMLEQMAGGLPIISMHYGASEGYFGVNLDPLCSPSQVKYTILPFLNFFEFIPMGRDPVTREARPAVDQIVDLAEVVIGQDYELVVTTFTGLYRHRVGDILRVTGFYNNTPQFEFIGRKNVVLSIDTDKTEEGDLQSALTAALEVLLAQLSDHKIHARLLDYSSFADVMSNPGHYVIFLELSGLGDKLCGGDYRVCGGECIKEYFEAFCQNMELHFSCIYSRNRREGIIGPLELRLVKEGSFELLARAAVARGAEIGQYKTPRCLKIGSDVDILNSRLQMQSVFSQSSPP